MCALENLEERGWQPIVVANSEGATYGDKPSTKYVNMVAELILRTMLELGVTKKVEIEVLAARVMIQDSPSEPRKLLRQELYEARIREYLTRLAVRRGLGADIRTWNLSLAKFDLGSGQYNRLLQIADLVCNASYTRRKLSRPVKDTLLSALGRFDFQLDSVELAERLDALRSDGRLGTAVIEILEYLNTAQVVRASSKVRVRVEKQLDNLMTELARLPHFALNAELRIIADWLTQIVDYQRDVDRTRALLELIDKHVLRGLLRGRSEEANSHVAWFELAANVAGLVAANHAGDPSAARRRVERLDALKPLVIDSWDRIDLVLGSLVVEAVHFTDCFDHQEVCRRMEAVAGCYELVGGLFRETMPSVFPVRPRAYRRGEALGTWLQAETMLALSDRRRQKAHLAKARELSEEALQEFEGENDRARQQQYRSQLEMVAGDLDASLDHLQRGVGARRRSHKSIGEALVGMRSEFDRGFGLLHWLRLADHLAAEQRSDDLRRFERAWRLAEFDRSPWLTGDQRSYPANGILRARARLLARTGQCEAAAALLEILEKITSKLPTRRLLSLVQVCAAVEVATLSPGREGMNAQAVLEKSAIPALRWISRDARRVVLPSLDDLAQKMSNLIGQVVQSRGSSRKRALKKLGSLASEVLY